MAIHEHTTYEYKIKLTPYAKIFYVEWAVEPDSYKYNMLCADQILYGHLDVIRLCTALNRYVTNHVLLNSHIQVSGEEPYWVKNFIVSETDYCAVPVSEAELLEYVQKPFDVYSGPLYRFKLLRLDENVHRLMVVMHHLVMDGVSLDTGIIDAISNYYNHPDYRIKHSMRSQVEQLTSLEQKLSASLEKNRPAHQHFWRQQLADVENVSLSFLQAPSACQSTQLLAEKGNPVAELTFSFNPAVLEKLKWVNKQYKITSFIYSQSIFAMLLHKYTGQPRFAVGYSVAVKEGIDFIYGSQVNVNLIPYHFEAKTTPIETFQHVRQFLLKTLKSEVKYGYCTIFDILHVVNNNKKLMQAFFAQAPFRAKPLQFVGVEKTESVLHMISVDGASKGIPIFDQEIANDKLSYRFKYYRESVNEELLWAFIDSYKKLFTNVLSDLTKGNDSRLIATYSLLSQEQYRQLVYGVNQTAGLQSPASTIHQRFEEQAAHTPNNIAVVYEGQKLTYQELNQRANQLAHYIQDRYAIQPEELVALCLDKNQYMIIAILAVLKCSGAYVPIAPDYPSDRINYLLKDTDARIVIVNEEYEQKAAHFTDRISLINLDNRQVIDAVNAQEKNNLCTTIAATNLAYVIYTSGTMGQPKGVLQQHDSVLNLFQTTEALYQFNASDVWPLFHAFVFDVSVWEIWGALLHGGKLVIPNHEQAGDFEKLSELFKETGVTILTQTSSAFYKLSEVLLKHRSRYLDKLRYIVIGGEKLNFLGLSAWFSSCYSNKPQLVNVYGVTELAVISTHKVITPEDVGEHCLIGKMRASQNGYVLGAELAVLPVGATGELYVGGVGLARGYLNKPELTRERFVSSPFQTDAEKARGRNARLYKTGDLVRRLPDGSLEYIGRNDTQLKIRGYRIEAGEIEALLCAYPGIKQSVVLAVADQNRSDANLPPVIEGKGIIKPEEIKQVAVAVPVADVREPHQKHDNAVNQAGLLPIQEWFFAQNFPHSHHWNQSFLIKTPELDSDILIISLTQLVNYHAGFSARYSMVNDVVQVHYVKQGSQTIDLLQLAIRRIPYHEGTQEFNDKLNEILTNWQSNFDITHGPLYAVGYISGYADGSARVFFALHHLIVDVISCHILVHDLKEIYSAALLANKSTVDISIPSRRLNQTVLFNHPYTSYTEWSQVVRSYALNNAHEKAYWLNVLTGHDQFDARLTRFITGNADSKPDNLCKKTVSFTVNETDTTLLLNQGELPLNYKINEILLAALAITVRELLTDFAPDSEQGHSVYLTIEGHGREDIDTQVNINHTLGWFTTMYPCKLTFEDSRCPLEIIELLKQTLDAVPTRGLGYGALFGYARGLPRISFNYLGQLNSQEGSADWSVTDEPAGQHIANQNKNSNVIDLVSWMVEGQLKFTLLSQLSQHQVNQFTCIFKARLITLIKLIQGLNEKNPDEVSGNCKITKSDQFAEFNKRLVAYYVSGEKLEQADIRDYLSKQLPQYSVPQEFIWLNTMPLTMNGKIDTEALSRLIHKEIHQQADPRNEKESLLCEVFAKVLNRKQVGIYDDFFVFGGDSISAISLTIQLQHYFNVHVRDIFSYRTPHQLAEKLAFSGNTLKGKLLEIMHEHEKQTETEPDNLICINRNVKNYLTASEAISVDIAPKKITNVLLTGATGYLGCNLLNQLLTHTDYHIYLFVRAESASLAVERINHKYQLYFSSGITKTRYGDRVSVLCADLEKANFGLSETIYRELAGCIDSVIHSAALVKQVGEADLFYEANVQATINLLAFTRLTKLRDFHYISTASLLENNPASFRQWGNYLTEEHLPEDLQPLDNNVYLKTKLEAESKVVSYRDEGVNTSIYRVGNLAFISKNSSVQENAETLSFAHWLEYFFKSGTVFSDTRLSISPVDCVANAIVKLFDKQCATQSIFHVFNPHLFDLVRYMQYDAHLPVKVLTVTEFIQQVIVDMESKTDADPIMRFLLAQGWLGVDGIYQFSQKLYLQNKTQFVLRKLEFEWSPITNEQFTKYLSCLRKVFLTAE